MKLDEVISKVLVSFTNYLIISDGPRVVLEKCGEDFSTTEFCAKHIALKGNRILSPGEGTILLKEIAEIKGLSFDNMHALTREFLKGNNLPSVDSADGWEEAVAEYKQEVSENESRLYG